MALDPDTFIAQPSLAKTASVATGGRTWGEMGATGQRSYTLPLPVLSARSLNPELNVVYAGNSGNGKCGIGWDFSSGSISRKVSKGVPQYEAADVMLAGGTDLRPEQNLRGKIKTTRRTRGKGRLARKFSVVTYVPRLETSFDLYERWTADDGHSFWIVRSADGSRYCYGINQDSCIYDPADPSRIAEWLLVEVRNAVGENIFYQYKRDDQVADRRFIYQSQRYLRQICYCNRAASADLLCLSHDHPEDLDWLFRLIVDYGERVAGQDDVPPFDANEFAWPVRSDPYRSHRNGFELGTRRLCQQFLLYNNLGPAKVLVKRLLLEYRETAQRYSQLKAAHYMRYDATGVVMHSPPLEYFYTDPEFNTRPQPFLPLDRMPGLNDGQPYHCVDLYSEGLPGFLCQYDGAWYYREPLRGTPGTDEIIYGPWTLLPLIPNADSSKPVVQILTDLTGDGHLDWVVAQPGSSGYYTLNPDRSWSLFKPFNRFPVEFFHHLSQLGDLIGDGLQSVAMIGPSSVRVYANLRDQGFAPGQDQPHAPDDRLPLFGEARSELVMFSGMGASGMELCRIRHDEIRCWISLGHGRFEAGFKLSALPFEYGEFDADRVRVADLDGSGAPAFIYLFSDYFEIWFNQGGNGLSPTPTRVLWPTGIRYDNLCQVTFADLQGLGCASLLLTVPHMKPQHWVYHFFSQRPYMLQGTNNNMGYNATLQYRSSAQYWLDEKREELVARKRPVCHLPFPQMVLKCLRQEDEITSNSLMQLFEYFEGYYDAIEREFRGFARVYQTDSELEPGKAESGHTAPMRVKNWFHVGHKSDQVLTHTCQLDDAIEPLGLTVVSVFDGKRGAERIPKRRATDSDIAYALAGRLLRSEVTQANDTPPARLFSLAEYRYRVREIVGSPSSLLVLEQETRSHQYERFMNDPRSQHVVNLQWNQFGLLEHSISVDCPRRCSDTDEPPFEEEDQRLAWRDSFDPQQTVFYLAETRADFIHLIDPPKRYLGLPSRQRSNAWTMSAGELPERLTTGQISFEKFAEHQASPEWTGMRELTSLSRQMYLQDANGEMLYPPHQGPTKQAVFDAKALAAYDTVTPAIAIRDELRTIGYTPMALFFPDDPAQDRLENLWSAQSGFLTFANADSFYQVTSVQQTASHGVTEITRDPNHLVTIAITQPDGCTTSMMYDPHTLLLVNVRDANGNTQETLHAADGQPVAFSFHGTEEGRPAGFDPLPLYPKQSNLSPAYAIANPQLVVANAAGAVRSDLFSWMPRLPQGMLRLKRKQWIAKGWILPSGHVRACAMLGLTRLHKSTASERTLLNLIRTAARLPVHSVELEADRYHDDPQQLIQIMVSFFDGFARPLQSKQLVPPGPAFVSDADGNLVVDTDGQPIEAPADPRWRVSGRVEYNHKGETIRVYRSYFLDTWHRINDSAMREHGYHDQLFYDAGGRPIKTINALGHLAYDIRHAWFTCSYDFNDTDESPPTKSAKPGKPVMPPKNTRKVSS